MCLIIKNPIYGPDGIPVPKIAENDIKVWKVMKKHPNNDNAFSGPFRSYMYELSRLYRFDMGNPRKKKVNAGKYHHEFWTMGVGTHSNDMSLKCYDARCGYVKAGVFTFPHADHFYVECTIPKGANYFEGKYWDYVSDALVVGDVAVPINDMVPKI